MLPKTTSGILTEFLRGDGRWAVPPATPFPTSAPQWVKYSFPYTALTAAAMSQDIVMHSLPQGGIIHATLAYEIVPFTGSKSLSGLLFGVGISGTPQKYMTYSDLFAGGSQKYYATLSGNESMTGATNIIIQFLSAGANLNTMLDGQLDVYQLLSTLPLV